MFELTHENNTQKDNLKIMLNGEIDISTAPDFKEKLYEVIGNGDKDIELYCDNLLYIDSTGLGILVGALKKVKQYQKNVYVFMLKENIRKLFKITGLDRVFILEEI